MQGSLNLSWRCEMVMRAGGATGVHYVERGNPVLPLFEQKVLGFQGLKP